MYSLPQLALSSVKCCLPFNWPINFRSRQATSRLDCLAYLAYKSISKCDQLNQFVGARLGTFTSSHNSAATQHTRGLSQQQVGTSLSGRLNNVHTHLTHTDTLASDYAIWQRFVVSFFLFFFLFHLIFWFDFWFSVRCDAPRAIKGARCESECDVVASPSPSWQLLSFPPYPAAIR